MEKEEFIIEIDGVTFVGYVTEEEKKQAIEIAEFFKKYFHRVNEN